MVTSTVLTLLTHIPEFHVLVIVIQAWLWMIYTGCMIIRLHLTRWTRTSFKNIISPNLSPFAHGSYAGLRRFVVLQLRIITNTGKPVCIICIRSLIVRSFWAGY